MSANFSLTSILDKSRRRSIGMRPELKMSRGVLSLEQMDLGIDRLISVNYFSRMPGAGSYSELVLVTG